MTLNIVVCCDGTGNQVGRNISNVLKLFRVARRDAAQKVYYNPGVGTIGGDDPWSRRLQNANAVFGLATGRGLNDEILGAYRFICQHYTADAKIFIFGFSRGAYAARAVAGLIHLIGLLEPDQLNLAPSALAAYGRANEENDLAIGWSFARITGARAATVHFLGAWDTVASMIVPRKGRLLPSLQMLPHTRTNPSVRIFRHAMAIDERRRMFRLNRWSENQQFQLNRFSKASGIVRQDIKQVWFAGVHSDVGGGYPETESGLSKFPLDWMIGEASLAGLRINVAARNVVVRGRPTFGQSSSYAKPDASAQIHDSMTRTWRILELIPKATKWREWPRPTLFGYYLPKEERRRIEGENERNPLPLLHQSVLDRMTRLKDYHPENLPAEYAVEPYLELTRHSLQKVGGSR